MSEIQQNDGRNAAVKTGYSYGTPCYDQSTAGVTRCNTSASPEYGPIVGYASTTVTHYDYGGAVLNKQTTIFSQDANNTIGRPNIVDVMTSGNVILSRTDYDYATESISGLANMFSYNSQTITTQYQNGTTSAALSRKVTYTYDPAFQGGSQYGNLTHIYSYDDAAGTPYQTVRRRYYPNVSGNYWLVNKASVESLYAGNLATLLSGAWHYYDGASDHTTPPTKGTVTRTRAFDPTINCSDVPGGGGAGCINSGAYKTIDTVATYDSFGNTLTTVSYSDYGYRTFNSSGSQVYNSFPSQSRTTTIAYDATYKLYPLSVTNPLGQATTFQIYGFNGTLDGFQKQPGLLKQVTEANGVVTKYEYDPFGRLYAVYDGYNFTGFGDTNTSNGDPVSRYLYYDNNWNNATTFLNPAGNAPFFIAALQRPGSHPAPASSSSGYAFNEHTYYDGFGRPIQSRSAYNWLEGQALSRDIYSSTAYHANGQANCQTVPYDLAAYSDRGLVWPASPFHATACTSQPRTTTTYDVLGRPDIVTAPDGSTTNRDYAILNNVTLGGYSKFSQVMVYDANNHRSDSYTNARGQLIAVREYSGTASPLHPFRHHHLWLQCPWQPGGCVG